MFTIEARVGRLVEIRMRSPIKPEELMNFFKEVATILGKADGTVVVCTDLRAARVFSQEITTKLLELMQKENPKIQRNGFLVSDDAVFSIQIERMIKKAGSGGTRRAMRDPEQLIKWLSEELEPSEVKRVRQFIVEGDKFVEAHPN